MPQRRDADSLSVTVYLWSYRRVIPHHVGWFVTIFNNIYKSLLKFKHSV